MNLLVETADKFDCCCSDQACYNSSSAVRRMPARGGSSEHRTLAAVVEPAELETLLAVALDNC